MAIKFVQQRTAVWFDSQISCDESIALQFNLTATTARDGMNKNPLASGRMTGVRVDQGATETVHDQQVLIAHSDISTKFEIARLEVGAKALRQAIAAELGKCTANQRKDYSNQEHEHPHTHSVTRNKAPRNWGFSPPHPKCPNWTPPRPPTNLSRAHFDPDGSP